MVRDGMLQKLFCVCVVSTGAEKTCQLKNDTERLDANILYPDKSQP